MIPAPSEVGTVGQAVQTNRVNLNFETPEALEPGLLVLAAREHIEVADRARVNGTDVTVAVIGGQGMRVGTEAWVPSLWSAGPLQLSDRSHVEGSIEAGSTPSMGNDVTVSGSINVWTDPPVLATRTISLDFGDCSNHVRLEPNQTRTLPPSDYGDVSVKSGAAIYLAPGHYRFNSLFVEPGGRIEVFSPGGPIEIAVRQSVTFRGQLLFRDAEVNLQLVVAGSDVTIDAPLHANIIAPNARVALNSHQEPFQGSVYARDLYVAPDVVVGYVSPDQLEDLPDGRSEPTLEELGLPDTAGPAPDLLDDSRTPAERAHDFITWAQRSTPGDAEAARDAIAQVRGNAEVTQALVVDTWQAIVARDVPRGLVALEVLAELDVPESEEVFTALVNMPAPTDGPWNSELNAPEGTAVHVFFQVKAVLGLGWRRTPTSKALLRQIAVSHESEGVSLEAIRVYVLYYGDAGREELATLLSPEKHVYLDRVETLDLDGRTLTERQEEFFDKYPDLMVPSETIPPEDPTQTCNVAE